MIKLTRLQIYKQTYIRHMEWYKKHVADGVITLDKASRISNIYAVKNTNRLWESQNKSEIMHVLKRGGIANDD